MTGEGSFLFPFLTLEGGSRVSLLDEGVALLFLAILAVLVALLLAVLVASSEVLCAIEFVLFESVCQRESGEVVI